MIKYLYDNRRVGILINKNIANGHDDVLSYKKNKMEEYKYEKNIS